MHTITDCPRCGEDFMYHQSDTFLYRVVAWDADTKEPCSFETICQNCNEKEHVTEAFKSELGSQCDTLFTAPDGRVFIRSSEAEEYCGGSCGVGEWFAEWGGKDLEPIIRKSL